MTGATFCWHCNRLLSHDGAGKYHFEEVVAYGATVRVHSACAPRARAIIERRHLWPATPRFPDRDEAPQ